MQRQGAQMNAVTDKHTDRDTVGCIVGSTDAWADVQTDVQTNVLTGRMDRMHIQLYRQMHRQVQTGAQKKETYRHVIRGEALRGHEGLYFLQAGHWNAPHHPQPLWLIPAPN